MRYYSEDVIEKHLAFILDCCKKKILTDVKIKSIIEGLKLNLNSIEQSELTINIIGIDNGA